MASSATTSTSLADELTSRLSHHIDLVAASITSTAASGSPGGSKEAENAGEQEEEDSQFASSSHSDAESTDGAESAASLAALSASLSRVRHRNHSGHGGHGRHGGWERAKRLTDEALRQQTGIKSRTQSLAMVSSSSSSSSSSPATQVEQLQWILNAHLTAAAWGAVLQQLLDEADHVKHEEEYWQSVEGEDSSGLMFLVQSGSPLNRYALRQEAFLC